MRTWRSSKSLLVWLTATSLLVVMLFLMLSSSREDALTFDEAAHIAAGYAYVKLRDARLNYEHPPLVKILAALPLLPLAPEFPLTASAWQDENNGQWETARIFLYESGNDPHRIAFLARLGPMGLTILLGLVLFVWTKNWAGAGAALLTLLLFVFSPTMLAHGRLVTTDVAAAFGVTLAGVAFIPFLAHPTNKAAILAGLALGVALLCKFSTFLLVPFMMALTLLWIGLDARKKWHYLGGFGIASVVAALVILVCFLWTTASYPPERQLSDSYRALFWLDNGPVGRDHDEPMMEYFALLKQDRTRDLRTCLKRSPAREVPRYRRCLAEGVIFLADKPVLRALAHYLYGLIWTMQRAGAGTTAAFPFYFLEEVSIAGKPLYFPIVYAGKETLPLHIFTAVALFLACIRLRFNTWRLLVVPNWLRGHPTETFMLGWVILDSVG